MDVKRGIVGRTFEFAVQVVRLGDRVPRASVAAKVLFSQVVRAGTSIGANVEEAQAGESRADFVHKYGIALKKARETHYWLRLFQASGILGEPDVGGLIHESDEIAASWAGSSLIPRRTVRNDRQQGRTHID